MTLNPDLIRAPKDCLDYVITPELCHLPHRDHTRNFCRLLDSILPGWERSKHRLELN